MKKHLSKLIAPIIITILLVLYFVFYIWIGLSFYGIPKYIKLLMLIIPIGLMILSIYMLFERIKEVKEGEEDDLSKY